VLSCSLKTIKNTECAVANVVLHSCPDERSERLLSAFSWTCKDEPPLRSPNIYSQQLPGTATRKLQILQSRVQTRDRTVHGNLQIPPEDVRESSCSNGNRSINGPSNELQYSSLTQLIDPPRPAPTLGFQNFDFNFATGLRN